MKHELLKLARATRDWIANPSRWTQHAVARKGDGSGTYSSSPDAASWCLFGAMLNREVALRLPYDSVYRLCGVIEKVSEGKEAADINDELGHGAVLAALDRAVRRLEAECGTAVPS